MNGEECRTLSAKRKESCIKLGLRGGHENSLFEEAIYMLGNHRIQDWSARGAIFLRISMLD